ncbi:MAG: CDP-alcohol phosphatidyltransferase family protein, partial [Balneolaceae bacterium]|nr:CDP-alcohol phosphatidyltransferase family protein [Balneolaceae bacterium]
MIFSDFFNDYQQSIKNVNVEEKYDLLFSRPLGFIFAKLLTYLGLPPTGISLLGMFVGVCGGVLLFWQDSLAFTATGSLLLIIAGLLDSADGQAARLTGNHTKLGRYIDGIIDNIVFIAAYTAAIFHFIDIYTVAGCVAIGLASGAVHSIKSCIYEYYKGEFLYYSGTDSSQRNDPIDKLNRDFDRSTFFRKFVHFFVVDYMKKQQRFKFRDDATTEQFEAAYRDNPERFSTRYIEKNKPMLVNWAWVCGSNIMRNSIIIFSLFG